MKFRYAAAAFAVTLTMIGLATRPEPNHPHYKVPHALCDTDYDCQGAASLDPTVNPMPISCQEDDPCWDCHTMGNHICGTFWYDGGAEDSGIEVYSDGAGVQYDGGDEVRTFPPGTFAYPLGNDH